MRRVVWSQAALDDMNEAVAYIAADNPTAAMKVLDRLEEAGQRLGEMALGRRGRVSGTFEKPVRNLPYIIAYALKSSQLVANSLSFCVLFILRETGGKSLGPNIQAAAGRTDDANCHALLPRF